MYRSRAKLKNHLTDEKVMMRGSRSAEDRYAQVLLGLGFCISLRNNDVTRHPAPDAPHQLLAGAQEGN